MIHSIGLDIGATKTLLACLDLEGNLIQHLQWETRKDPKKQLEEIQNHIKNISFESIGIGVAGQVSPKEGIVNWAPNLGWENFPLGKILQEQFKLPVVLTNDVRAAAFGEWKGGAGKGCKHLLCLFVGTGVGGGIVANDQLLSGATAAAGEVGHMILDREGPLCACGMQGCLEAFCGGSSIAKLAEKRSAKEVAEDSKEGDIRCQETLNNAKIALCKGVVSLIHVLNPQKVILGGGIIQAFPEWIDAVKNEVETFALKASITHLEIVPAMLGRFSCAIGAGLICRPLLPHKLPL